MLKELAKIKEQAKLEVTDKYNSKFTISSEIEDEILNAYTTRYPDKPARIIDHMLRVESSTDISSAQTSFLSLQWFLRIACCEELIVSLKEFSIISEKMRTQFGDDKMKLLPQVDWQSKLNDAFVSEIKVFLDDEFGNDLEKKHFIEFLDGRSWLDIVESADRGLAGRNLKRRPNEYIGSAISSVVRLINSNAGYLSDFIDLYVGSEVLRTGLSSLKVLTGGSVVSKTGGENVIFYGAPGTGKSYKIDKHCSEANSVRTVFHPDTQYSDFVGYLKPCMSGKDVVYVQGHSFLRFN
jgi:5-methylcytosine-specific restriction protein B